MTKIDLSRVKRKPALVEMLPWLGHNTGQAIYPNIYLSRSLYDDAHSKYPSPYTIGLIMHEQEHHKRMVEAGVFRWYVKYLLSPKFRIAEELAVTKPQMSYIKKSGSTFDLQHKARRLSGWLYFWPCSYESALSRLKSMWETV